MTTDDANTFARSLDPSARVLVKEDTVVGRLLPNAAVTIGNRIYVPRGWFERDSISRTIVHELAHVRQYRWCGLGIHPLAGIPLFAVLYLLLFFPVMLAWPRYRLELQAASKVWTQSLKLGRSRTEIYDDGMLFADTVAGKPYLYPWPKPLVRRGFERKLKEVLKWQSTSRVS